MTLSVYQANWSWDTMTEEWLKGFVKGKYTLNFPCGTSKIGDVRADITPTVKPDVVCSFENHKFKPRSFDLVISDPPFRFKDIQRWGKIVSELTRSELLISTPHIMVDLPGFKRKIFATCRTGSLFVRFWIYAVRQQEKFDNFKGPTLEEFF